MLMLCGRRGSHGRPRQTQTHAASLSLGVLPVAARAQGPWQPSGHMGGDLGRCKSEGNLDHPIEPKSGSGDFEEVYHCTLALHRRLIRRAESSSFSSSRIVFILRFILFFLAALSPRLSIIYLLLTSICASWPAEQLAGFRFALRCLFRGRE